MTDSLINLLIKLVIAIACGSIANILVPRRIPGGLVGLILIGLAGIWLGEWAFALFRKEFGINFAFLYWQIQGVLVVPAIVGCAIVLYLISAFVRWGRFE
ncbi:MAG: hypothetical protein KME15_08120 [Drouetiella hepatica Uher 2000/2452]|jgi:uncharacterized membrane protein YeaQ/YmgE (transglycosylase-associated protein family)|uniref:Uncharacterized protein n=1 Tax=Drouetiella hepatica Uher 2000/2452 TaxID=904376 RepID=A0A951ULR7_9CYAN|nr:hypothetical protein [Drouetiella hepatica Uher 2000/2452]